MDPADDNENMEESLQDDFIEESLASGDFASFPPPPANCRSLSCSRLVDENNRLKSLPSELIRGVVLAWDTPSSATVPEDEEVNIETSEVTLSSPICLEAASAPVARPPRLRKSREQRRSDLISQGGRKVSKPCFISTFDYLSIV